MKNASERTPERQAGHTPGPWKAEFAMFQERDNLDQVPIFDAMSAVVAYSLISRAGTVTGDGESTREQEIANARLIAAAPELLAALKTALAVIGLPLASVDRVAISDTIRAAIAKAEGRT